jgi:4-amino-4-deoxy-L-arabinose transferase-like glycosyltransferase
VLWIIALSAAARVAIAVSNGLCFGESYYFSCARHPSLSYFDHPPLSILLGSASLWATGAVGRLVLRWPFIALFAGTSWLMFLLGRRLYGGWAAVYGVLLLNLSPIFTLSVGTYFQPEGPLMLCWVACAWCLAHVLVGPPSRRPLAWWAAAGTLLGLGMLSKYAAVLLVVGAGLYVLTRREAWHWLGRPGPYVALAIAAALFAPVLVWNARHGFVSFVFQSTRGLDQYRGMRLDWLAWNIGGQALVMLPWVWAGMLAALIWSFASRPARPERRFVAWLSVTPIVLFTGVAAYSITGQHHFHWTTPGFLLLFLPLGALIERGLERRPALYRGGLWATAAFSLIGMGLVTSHIATGWAQRVPGLSTVLVGIEDPTYECIDLDGLERAFAERGLLDRRDIFVFSDWWFRAGKVDFALRGRLPVLAFTRNDPRGFAFFDTSERWLDRDGILVTTKSPAEVDALYWRYFDRLEPLGAVPVGRRGRAEFTLYLYRGEQLLAPYPQPYGESEGG